MKAFYMTRFGGPEVMQYGDLPEPTPGKGEVLVDVKASSINPVDWKLRGGMMKLIAGRGLPKPLGSDFAGVVRAVGPGVTGFAAGDRGYGAVLTMLGKPGTHAERVVARAKDTRRLPEGWTFEQGAALPVAALTATAGLRKCGDLSGKTVLVNGATGGVGHMALQIAKVRGARVVAVCSARNAELARSLGADEVLDYNEVDVTAPGRTWDVFFDAFGQTGFSRAARALAASGVYVTTLPRPDTVLRSALGGVLGGKRVALANMRSKPEDYAELERLIEGGVKVVLETFPLERAAEAFAACEGGKVRGKVVLTAP
ncbi:NAD(P)-dependent alcohol dehydrogenase [Sorangium sp. So ce1335]|uniref:NAD(P)-dependent alcohol dehydrogenase n=1 Tax=Sorangium sp. So ce1335 TaxID=3133335 RepID=UPI003F5F4A9A